MNHFLRTPAQIERLLDVYLSRHPRNSNAIYLCLLTIALCGIASLPLVRINLTMGAPGMLRPSLERQEIFSPVTGYVSQIAAGLGDHVEANQAMILFDTGPHEIRVRAVQDRLRTIELQLRDLLLVAGGELSADGLRSGDVIAEQAELQSLQAENRVRIAHLRSDSLRSARLAEVGLLPEADADAALFALSEAIATGDRFVAGQVARWQERIATLRSERTGLLAELASLQQERDNRTVEAPTSGTIEEIVSLSPQSFVQAGQRLAVISPESEPVAEAFINPARVGELEEGMKVRIHVDAFDYMEWGALQGTVARISEDIVLAEAGPAFRVTINLDETELRTREGAAAFLRKGMSVRVHFALGRRSMLDILRGRLFDRVDPRLAPLSSTRIV